jgi:hypothetical protein
MVLSGIGRVALVQFVRQVRLGGVDVRRRHALERPVGLQQVDGAPVGEVRHRQPGDAVERGLGSATPASSALAWARKRRSFSACLRRVMSRHTPAIDSGRPSASRRTTPRPSSQRTPPSGHTTRYSTRCQPEGPSAFSTSARTRALSSGCTTS